MSPHLNRFLRRHRTVAADTMLFIYHLQRHPRYVRATRSILGRWEEGSSRGITSVISLAEMLVKPFQDGDFAEAAEYRHFFSTFPNLQVLDVTQAVAEGAAQARASYGLALPDAIHLATAMAGRATGFVTNDPTFKRVAGIEVLLLDEAAAARR